MTTLEQLRAVEFPEASQSIYLNHAASSFLPARSAAVLEAYSRDRQRVYHLYQQGTYDFDPAPLRTALGTLLRCPAHQIALVNGTSDAIASVLNAIDWRAGDAVVVPTHDFPGIVNACRRLARQGVEVHEVPGHGVEVSVPAIMAHATPRTRAVVASHVHWTTGVRLDIAALGVACRARGVLSIIDAIQSLGNQQIDVQAAQVDVLAAATYKWLLGIPGAAVLRVDDRVLDQLMPDRRGWLSVTTPSSAATEAELWPDARRFEVGTPSEAARRVLQPSVELLLEIGDDVVAAHALDLTTQLIEVLDRRGLTVLTPREQAHRGAIVSFTSGDETRDAALAKGLLERRVVVARRGAGLRAAPHITNTVDDIQRFEAALDEIR